jgi:hypothetical protein
MTAARPWTALGSFMLAPRWSKYERPSGVIADETRSK